MLGPILTKHYPKPIVGGSMWHSFSLADIHAIHEWICDEMKKGAASPVLADFESPSYWTKNFCSAAVRAYSEFLAAEHFENGIVGKVKGETSGKAVAQKAEALIDTTLQADLEAHLNLTAKEGKEKLAAVKVRVNQDIFRKMVLANYGGKCCVTGLSVPDVLRASHISPWAEDEKNRLNPENGLCLSAACFVDLKIITMWRTVENVAA
jgi:putative restriction endonuclease